MSNYYIPETLQPILPHLTYSMEICKLCHLIYTNTAYDEHNEPYPYVQLRYEYIREVLGRHKTKPALEEAIKFGIIRRRDEGKKGAYYVVDYQAKLYQIGSKYIKDDMIEYVVEEPKRAVLPKPFAHNLRGINLKLFNMLSNLEIQDLTNAQLRVMIDSRIEYSARKKMTNKHLQYRKLRCEVDKIRNKEFYAKVGTNNKRLFTNLVSLRREARSYLTSRGKRLVQFDMSCTQPHIFFILLSNKLNALINERAIYKQCFIQYVGQTQKRYQKHAENSTFSKEENIFTAFQGDLERFYEKELKNSGLYDNIAEFLQCSRDEAKIELLRYFFGRHYSKRFPITEYFNTHYPILHIVCGYIKRKDSKILATQLQKQEAEIFIHTIAKRIIEENPNIVIYTIHDAIVCEEGPDEVVVEHIVKDELNKIFLSPRIKRGLL